MAKTVAKILGLVFVLVGAAGFAKPDLLGAHLNMAHNVVHLVSGVIALYFGFAGSASGARAFCLIFGAVYFLLGAVLFGITPGPDHMKTLGPLMLGKVDHIIHLALGVILLAAGALSKKAD